MMMIFAVTCGAMDMANGVVRRRSRLKGCHILGCQAVPSQPIYKRIPFVRMTSGRTGQRGHRPYIAGRVNNNVYIILLYYILIRCVSSNWFKLARLNGMFILLICTHRDHYVLLADKTLH